MHSLEYALSEFTRDIESKLDQLESGIDTLGEQVEQVESGIHTLREQVEQVESRLLSAVDKLSTKVRELERVVRHL